VENIAEGTVSSSVDVENFEVQQSPEMVDELPPCFWEAAVSGEHIKVGTK
jgi:hypothetical protein